MTGDWRKLAVAALAVVAMGLASVEHADAQGAPAKGTGSAQPATAGKAKKAAAPKQQQDPVDAQQSIEVASKLLGDGKSAQAEETLTTLLKGGKLPPAIMAKALLYRGIAYRQQKKPTQAIADLTSALWVKGGLAEDDRRDALRQRASAYQEAGLSDDGEAIADAIPSNARAPSTRTASASGLSEGGATGGSGAAKQGNGWSLTNPFAALFGGSSSSSASGPPPQEAGSSGSTASIEPAAPRRPVTSSWSSSTEVLGGGNGGSARPPAAAEPHTAAAEPRAATARPDGKVRVQVGMVRTQAEAEALAGRVQRDHAAALAAREPQIDHAVVGNMGSFYRVRFGPYASVGEGQAACARLRGPGIDCMVIAP